jgi:hypothetical protein
MPIQIQSIKLKRPRALEASVEVSLLNLNLGCTKTIEEGEYRLKHGKNKISYFKVLGVYR